MGDVSELRAVRGFDAEIVARLLPYVCVRPTSAPNLINPNTLLVDQAPLLAMALGDLTAEEARALIRDRPRGGWEDLNAFFRHGRLATLELDEAVRAQFSLQTRYFVVLSEVEREAGSETAAALVMSPPGGRAVVMRRLFGVGRGVSLL
jgi:general secretion pathway protein K